MATQPIGRQANGNVSLNDEDIFDMPTQRIENNDIYDAATQLQPINSDDVYEAATQPQSEMNDVFDAPTQRLNVQRNEKKSPEPEPSSGIRLGPPPGVAFESQLSPVQTPPWSLAKLIPKEPAKKPEKPISKKEANLTRKQQWLFNMSDDEEDDDNDNDDLEFDLTPRKNDSVRFSMLDSSTESKSVAVESSPKPQVTPETVHTEKPKPLSKRKPDNEVLTPAKRTRSLSIVLSREEVCEYLVKGSDVDSQQSVSSKLVRKSKRKAEKTQEESSTPNGDGQSKSKTETTLKRVSGKKPEPKANKIPQTTLNEIPVTRNLRTKNNNKSPVGKADKTALKRKSSEIDADENQKQSRKRTTKVTTVAQIPSKFRAFHTESKATKKDNNQRKEEKTKEPAKDTKTIKPKMVKPPKAAPVVREVRFIHTLATYS